MWLGGGGEEVLGITDCFTSERMALKIKCLSPPSKFSAFILYAICVDLPKFWLTRDNFCG